MTLTYNPILAKVDPHAKNQGRRSSGLAMSALTNGQRDRWYQICFPPPCFTKATWSIISYGAKKGHTVVTGKINT